MKTNKIKLSTDQRPFTIVYNDFLETDLLDWNEKRVFIYLKKFSDSNNQCFPSIKTLCGLCQLSNKTVIKALKGLEGKQIITKQPRRSKKGGQQSNLYTIHDYQSTWDASKQEQAQAQKQEQEAIRLLESMGYTVSKNESNKKKESNKEKESNPDAPDKETSELNTKKTRYPIYQDSTVEPKSQAKRYGKGFIKKYYGYDDLVIQYPEKRKDIDIVFDILDETLNSTKQTIRISGEDKQLMVVIGKLMKLKPEDLVYSIEQYHGQTTRIKNVKGYLLTILYHSNEQYYLDLMNLGHYHGSF